MWQESSVSFIKFDTLPLQLSTNKYLFGMKVLFWHLISGEALGKKTFIAYVGKRQQANIHLTNKQTDI